MKLDEAQAAKVWRQITIHHIMNNADATRVHRILYYGHGRVDLAMNRMLESGDWPYLNQLVNEMVTDRMQR